MDKNCARGFREDGARSSRGGEGAQERTKPRGSNGGAGAAYPDTKLNDRTPCAAATADLSSFQRHFRKTAFHRRLWPTKPGQKNDGAEKKSSRRDVHNRGQCGPYTGLAVAKSYLSINTRVRSGHEYAWTHARVQRMRAG